jgi:hypothetical protein
MEALAARGNPLAKSTPRLARFAIAFDKSNWRSSLTVIQSRE